MNFNRQDKKIIKLFKQLKEEFLLTQTEKSDVKAQIYKKIDKLNISVTKPEYKRYSVWSYKLNFKGVIMPLVPIILAILIAGGVGTAALADNANPGDTLFGLDQFMEDFQENWPMSQSHKAKFFAGLSEERAQELMALKGMDPEELNEKKRERWERHQEDAVSRLAASIEKVESVQERFQEKIDSTDLEEQKEVFQKVIDHLEAVKARRETKLNEIESGEAPGLRGFPIRQHIKNWKGMSKEEIAEIKAQVKEDFGEIMDDFKTRMKQFKRGEKPIQNDNGDDEDETDEDEDEADDSDGDNEDNE